MQILFLFILAGLSHIHSLSNGFALDDYSNILDNPLIKDPSSWPAIFTTPHYPGNLFRPVTQLSYALTFYLVGANPFLYHLTNLLLHLGVTLFTYLFLRELLTNERALIATCLFTAFPIHSEAVANISGRAELLSTFFILSALLFSLSKISLLILVASGLCTFLALLSKENAIVAPLLLVLTLLYLKRNTKETLIALSPLAAAIVVYLLLRLEVIGSLTNPQVINLIDNQLIEINFLPRIFVALSLLGRYLIFTLLPFHLSADYSAYVFNLNSFKEFTPYFCAIILLLIFSVKNRNFTFGTLWFFLAFLVTSNILFPIGTIFAERLVYLPSIGIACVASYLINSRVALSIFIAFYCSINFLHDYVWQDNETLHTYQLSVSPMSAKTQLNYGVLERNRGNFDSAMVYVNKALSIYPQSGEAFYVRATIFAQKGDLERVNSDLENSLQNSPEYLPAINLLGRIKLNNKEYQRARELFEKSNNLASENPDSIIGLFALALSEPNPKEIERLYPKLTKLARDNKEAHMLLSQLKGIAS